MTEITPGAPPPGGGDGQNPPAGNQPPGNEAPFWNDLPENMRGQTAEETLQKVLPSWKGYHEANSKREPALTKPEDFTLDITNEKAKPFFSPKDPSAQAFTKAAIEAGLTKTQAGKLADSFMGQLAESGALQKPVDPVAVLTEQAKLLGFEKMDDKAKVAMEQAHTEMMAWAENTATQLGLSEAGKIELESLTLTPGGFEIVRALRAKAGETGFKLGGDAASPLSKEGVLARLNDPKANSMSANYDASFRAAAEADWEKLHQSR